MNNFDKDTYIRLTPDNYKLLLDNARREGAEKAREEMLDVTTKRSIETAKEYAEKIVNLQSKLEKSLGALKFYSLFDFKGNPHFQAIAREALKEIER
jgi:hypothetical protein